MQTLTTAFDEARQQHLADPLVLIPLAVLDFLCIHPFRDGNGRIARLLTQLLLYHFDYRVGAYIGIERIIEQSRAALDEGRRPRCGVRTRTGRQVADAASGIDRVGAARINVRAAVSYTGS